MFDWHGIKGHNTPPDREEEPVPHRRFPYWLTEPDQGPDPFPPEHRLYAAVIFQAIIDICNLEKGSWTHTEAIRWLRGAPGVLTVRECCEPLDLDPARVYAAAVSIAESSLFQARVKRRETILVHYSVAGLYSLLLDGEASHIHKRCKPRAL